MAERSATELATFSRFSSLPPELRNQIWGEALPARDGPALYFYKKGFWRPEAPPPSDGEQDREEILEYEFRHELLDRVQVDIPLAFVNREARSIALVWLQEQGIETHFGDNRQRHVFMRPFDPVQDVLYVAHSKWADFCSEPYDRLFEPDLFERTVNTSSVDFTQIAIPEALLQSENDALSDMLEWFFNIRILYIIIGTEPGPIVGPDGREAYPRWELAKTRGRSFYWQAQRFCFALGDGEPIAEDSSYKRIEEASRGLAERLAREHVPHFEIRPALAIRR
ncbi:hypothetical protein GQ53DRAFT_749378 [Thozetella sp. PMI_491]|nr:hypothetical protein GQ53DRAFT_749378 [Thozetella sp. PMI_491]